MLESCNLPPPALRAQVVPHHALERATPGSVSPRSAKRLVSQERVTGSNLGEARAATERARVQRPNRGDPWKVRLNACQASTRQLRELSRSTPASRHQRRPRHHQRHPPTRKPCATKTPSRQKLTMVRRQIHRIAMRAGGCVSGWWPVASSTRRTQSAKLATRHRALKSKKH